MKRPTANEKVIEVEHIDKDNYEEYIGKTVKVTNDVYLSGLGFFSKIPINFTEVGRDFDCSDNNLTSLEGAPEKVGRNFKCSNNKLTSLEGGPIKVGENFNCSNNQLSSLKGGPKEVVWGDFTCSTNKLTSLKGAPKVVGGSFYCYPNNLKSTKGKPGFIGGKFGY